MRLHPALEFKVDDSIWTTGPVVCNVALTKSGCNANSVNPLNSFVKGRGFRFAKRQIDVRQWSYEGLLMSRCSRLISNPASQARMRERMTRPTVRLDTEKCASALAIIPSCVFQVFQYSRKNSSSDSGVTFAIRGYPFL